MTDRQLTILDPAVGSRYADAVSAVAPRIEASLGSQVVANRVSLSGTSPPLRLEPWRPARARFFLAARHRAKRARVMVVADVRDCYRSIGPDVVAGTLRSLGCFRQEIEDVVRVLERIHRNGVPGLPVGPEPSAVLANAVLATADRALSALGVHHLRWVDDVWAFAPSRRAGACALESFQGSLDVVGLGTAEEKTALLEDPSAMDVVVHGVRGSSSPVAPSYHRRSDAHALPGVPHPHAVVPANGRVDPGGRTPRATCRDR